MFESFSSLRYLYAFQQKFFPFRKPFREVFSAPLVHFRESNSVASLVEESRRLSSNMTDTDAMNKKNYYKLFNNYSLKSR